MLIPGVTHPGKRQVSGIVDDPQGGWWQAMLHPMHCHELERGSEGRVFAGFLLQWHLPVSFTEDQCGDEVVLTNLLQQVVYT